jgi:spore coat protein A, manganese oxidase
MRSFLAAFGKAAFYAALVLALTVPTFAQMSLRDAVDSDGDNKADYLIFRPSNNQWYIAKSGGGIRVQQFGIYNEDFMVPGDYDGDGIGEIAVWRETNGNWYRLNSASNTFTVNTWGEPGDEPVARDYDGDGKADMTVVRRSNGVMTWYFVYSLTGFASRQFGVSTDFIAPGDYDGDGKFDLAVQRPGATPTSATSFYIQTATTFLIQNFGETRDLVVPGDYDGDGKTDLAVVREGSTPTAELTWYVRRSTDGHLVVRNWGVTGTDLNVQNDYDGDGKTDFAIWRNSDGKFYVITDAGAISVVSWGAPNDLPIASYDTH